MTWSYSHLPLVNFATIHSFYFKEELDHLISPSFEGRTIQLSLLPLKGPCILSCSPRNCATYHLFPSHWLFENLPLTVLSLSLSASFWENFLPILTVSWEMLPLILLFVLSVNATFSLLRFVGAYHLFSLPLVLSINFSPLSTFQHLRTFPLRDITNYGTGLLFVLRRDLFQLFLSSLWGIYSSFLFSLFLEGASPVIPSFPVKKVAIYPTTVSDIR
jgi:hypothetical protein